MIRPGWKIWLVTNTLKLDNFYLHSKKKKKGLIHYKDLKLIGNGPGAIGRFWVFIQTSKHPTKMGKEIVFKFLFFDTLTYLLTIGK